VIKKPKKFSRRVKDLVPTRVSDKAAELNPLNVPEPQVPSLEDVPQITNETIAEHREEVLKGARKYIYPLQHSKHRIVLITVAIGIAAAVSFLVYCSFALYRYYQYNTFIYRVTQVAPFPVAKAGNRFVAYESYLFELRHYVHYYQNQNNTAFLGGDQQQLVAYRKQALQDVINHAYIKTLAASNKVKVSDKEVNARIEQVRAENRLGSNNKVFADVLRSYWGWSINDFKRSLKEQILAEKVVAKLDSGTTKRANDALAQLKAGTDFTTVAKQFSDDPGVATNNGDYGINITKDNANIQPQVVSELFKLKPGQVSGIINAGGSLEIVKVTAVTGNVVTAQHISFKLKDINTYIDQLKKTKPAQTYIRL
jgi:hypothetical protein